MTNPIIDALSWNPDNPAASIRALQTALTTLQTEWATKIPPLGQISRNGQVYESDWNVFESDRDDATFLHFDNETPDFRGEWANILGVVRPVEGAMLPGFSEFTEVNVINNYISVVGAFAVTTTIMTITIELKRDALFFIWFPLMVNRTVGAGTVTFLLEINGVSQYDMIVTPVSGSWELWYHPWISSLCNPGSYTIRLRVQIPAGTTVEFAQIAPLPNVVGTSPIGIITPSLAYVETIYQ